jgi:hypothetical protein
MGTFQNDPGFETWKAIPSGRAVQNADGFTGSWKTMWLEDGDGDHYEFFVSKAWVGGYCNIHVFAVDTGADLAEGRHRTEKESWKMAKRMLIARGYPLTM